VRVLSSFGGRYARTGLPRQLPTGLYGLSAPPLLALTAVFVMVSELLNILPSIAPLRFNGARSHRRCSFSLPFSSGRTPDQC